MNLLWGCRLGEGQGAGRWGLGRGCWGGGCRVGEGQSEKDVGTVGAGTWGLLYLGFSERRVLWQGIQAKIQSLFFKK